MSALERLADLWLDWFIASAWQLAVAVCLVAAVCRVARSLSPRWRHTLWLIVLVKAFLPPNLTAPWSVGNWLLDPIVERAWISAGALGAAAPAASVAVVESEPHVDDASKCGHLLDLDWTVLAMCLWATGCLAFWFIVLARYIVLTRRLRAARSIEEGPVRIAYERLALELGVRRAPELLATRLTTSPFLVGAIRPRIVLSEDFLTRAGDAELQATLAHELIHWRRRDTWVGWLQVLAQGLYWHHPFFWWANRELRHERECACDESVLQLGQVDVRRYGDSLFRALTAASGRSFAGGSLVGVFERGTRFQDRMERIMNYDPNRRRSAALPSLGVVALALLILPMAATVAEPTNTAQAAGTENDGDGKTAKTPYPQILKAVPAVGSSDVDFQLTEISITFDRDMQKGMSWTGGPPVFPPVDRTAEARWIDARTCVLPVKLARASYYRLGINSSSYRNFKGADGVPVPPAAIYFTTQGANKATKARLRVPKVALLEPAGGATDVDPATTTLRVTFDMPMGEGMSWTGGGESFPDIPEGEQAEWSKDGRTCTLPVRLLSGHQYRLGLNSLSHINFQSRWGVPVEPVVYEFTTTGAAAD